MSSEIEVPETPNWLGELEAKRERRLKARLAHESGAGAPCLKCGEKCPGLDLHFWRKCCKICKCPKEEHEVQDDDIYGWAQFQLLGSKPNKIKTKIVLPGKKDEVELDWAPKGHKETVDKYLKTLPPEQLPVKGSQAAQDRKQLLQKQIPVHDIDPTLCHELTEDELKKMNDYIDHVKQTSVGVGQIVSLSNVIKGHLHKLNPNEAAVIASRYAKGVPLTEIVKLQAQNRAALLKSQNINQGLDKLNLNDPNNKTLPAYLPNSLNPTEHNLNPMVGNKIHDVNYQGYTRDTNQALSPAQFSKVLKPGQQKVAGQHQPFDPTIDEQLLQGTNFDPKGTPSHFLHPSVGAGSQANQNQPGFRSGAGTGSSNSAFVPYSKVSSEIRPGESYVEENSSSKVNYASSLPRNMKDLPSEYKSGRVGSPNTIGGYRPEQNYSENLSPQNANYSKNLLSSLGRKSGHPVGQFANSGSQDGGIYENVEEMKKRDPQALPSYLPGKYNVHSEVQSPTKVPKSVRDLAFSTYDQNSVNPSEMEQNRANQNQSYGQYPSGIQPLRPGYDPSLQQQNVGQSTLPYGSTPGAETIGTFDRSSSLPRPGAYSTGLGSGQPAGSNNQTPSGLGSGLNLTGSDAGGTIDRKIPDGAYPGGFRPLQPTGSYNTSPSKIGASSMGDPTNTDPNIIGASNVSNKPGIYPSGLRSGQLAGSYNPSGLIPGPNNAYPSGSEAAGAIDSNFPSDGTYPSGFRPSHPVGGYDSSGKIGDAANTNPNGAQLPSVAYENYPSGPISGVPAGTLNKPDKKLSELHPGRITVDEDFLEPSQVLIGAIQDINYPEIKAATHGTNDFYEDYSPDSLREILNNIILPDCHYCKKPFEENEYAITIDRANVLFHAECFKCAGCNQILADNVYFYNKETDNVYCGRDYAKIRGFPRCKACDELIFTKEYCLAENSTFHLKHFCCIECDKPLAGQDYTLEDEMPYCLPCFEQSKASKCSSCGSVIKPDEMGCNLNGVHFHASDGCFACKMCRKPLMGKKMLLRNGKLYCSHDCYGADK